MVPFPTRFWYELFSRWSDVKVEMKANSDVSFPQVLTTVLLEWYSWRSEAKDIPVNVKWRRFLLKRDRNVIGTNYYWNKCFPKWSHWIFPKTSYKNRSECQMKLLYLWFICWRERGFCVDLGSGNIYRPWSETGESWILFWTVLKITVIFW
jgi:hypothetical protein